MVQCGGGHNSKLDGLIGALAATACVLFERFLCECFFSCELSLQLRRLFDEVSYLLHSWVGPISCIFWCPPRWEALPYNEDFEMEV